LSEKRNVLDLSKFNFSLEEIKHVFVSLNFYVEKTTLRIYNDFQIPVIARLASQNPLIFEIVLIREGIIHSIRNISQYLSENHTILLQNFSEQETQVFLYEYLFTIKNQLNSLTLFNIEDELLKNNFMENNNLRLESLIIKNDQVTTYKSIPVILQSPSPQVSLKVLKLIGFTNYDDSLTPLLTFLENSNSIEKVQFYY